MSTQYLIDYHWEIDEQKLFGTSLHLLTFNPSRRDATLDVTVYHEDREPDKVALSAVAGKSNESNYSKWPVQRGERFALKIDSSEPVVCQCTVAWNNSLNHYAPGSETHAPEGLRECAWTYTAHRELNTDWYAADCIVINNSAAMYVKEVEWVIVLNPGNRPAGVKLELHYGDGSIAEHPVEVGARRLKAVCVDDIGRQNAHYGLYVRSDTPVAVQSARGFYWYDRPDLMNYWTVPCVPGPLG